MGKIIYGLVSIIVIWFIGLGLSGCSNYVKTYHPGYYQGRQIHDAYYRSGYYDYFGDYHPGKWYPQYVEPGRWVHGFISYECAPPRGPKCCCKPTYVCKDECSQRNICNQCHQMKTCQTKSSSCGSCNSMQVALDDCSCKNN